MATKNLTNLNQSKKVETISAHIIPSQNVRLSETRRFLERLLALGENRAAVLFSLGKALVGKNDNPTYTEFLASYDYDDIVLPQLPDVIEFDLLGSAYQFLNSKYDNLSSGTFYTGREVAEDFVSDLDFSREQRILDPACGSGVFLFSSNASPEQLWGIDADAIAVMIAKFNYFIKFPDAPAPNIFCSDFFSWMLGHTGEKFDYIITNPPYGADMDMPEKLLEKSCIKTGESFSYFIEFAYPMATSKARFLIPESLLNVKRHDDIRRFILEKTDLSRIKCYSKRFSGVLSDVYGIEMEPLSLDSVKEGRSWNGREKVTFVSTREVEIPKEIYAESSRRLFVLLDEEDVSLLARIESAGRLHIPEHAFALGIVTGGNKDKLFPEAREGSEPIYTGKEITGRRYSFLPVRNHIIYKREQMQQVAPDAYYRAPVKLVYKSVSKYLKVVIDDSGSLTTNTASIILPEVGGISAYALLALLNSRPLSFYHVKMSGGVNKIAKEDMMAMPLPELTEEQQAKLEEMVGDILEAGGGADHGEDAELLAYIEEEIYGLDAKARRRLADCLPF